MTELIVRLPAVASASGVFSASVMARDRGNGSWEGWLEFAPADAGAATTLITGIETRQHDRVALERWASGLTRVYAEGALARAKQNDPPVPESDLVVALQDIVETLDRRLPEVERAGELHVAAGAKRLRAAAIERIAVLHRQLEG